MLPADETRRGGNRAPTPVTKVPPCSHNTWTRSRRRRMTPGVRLRCVVCRSLWVTLMSYHEKCSGFYSGTCQGDCGKPHIFARGTVPDALAESGETPSQHDPLRKVTRKPRSRSEDDEGAASVAPSEDQAQTATLSFVYAESCATPPTPHVAAEALGLSLSLRSVASFATPPPNRVDSWAQSGSGARTATSVDGSDASSGGNAWFRHDPYGEDDDLSLTQS